MKRTSRLTYLTSLVVIILSALCFVSCEKEDSKAPQITVINDGPVDVTGGAVVKTAGASLRIGDNEIATWTDDRTAAEMCKVTIAFDGKAISEGTTLDKAGKLTLSVADEAGNMSSSSVTTWIDSNAPQITLASEAVNVFGGLELTSAGGALFIGENEIARWSDDKTSAEQCTVTATLDGEAISIGTVLDKAGVLKFVITDDAGNVSEESTVTLIDNALNGLDSLSRVSFTVDHEYNLTGIISTCNGFAITKVEMLLDGSRTTIADPAHFSSDRWGDASFIITISREDGRSEEIAVDGIKINPFEFSSYTIDKALNEICRVPNFEPRNSTHLIETGVFDTQSILLEAIANGTMTMTPETVKATIGKNTLVMCAEYPGDENGNKDEYCEQYFECVVLEGEEYYDMIDLHADLTARYLLIHSEPILKKLGKKIISPLYEAYFSVPDYGLPYVKNHPELNFFFSTSIGNTEYHKAGTSIEFLYDRICGKRVYDGYQEFLSLDNVFMDSYSMTNFGVYNWETQEYDAPNIVSSTEEIINGDGGGFLAAEFLGANMVMGSNIDGITHGYSTPEKLREAQARGEIAGGSCVPSPTLSKDDRVWSDVSCLLRKESGETTSQACPDMIGKAYLATCANMLVNPSITKEENYKLLRSNALDGTVLLDGEYYFPSKRMNPGGMLYQFYSKLPETISLSASKLIPIEHSLHINSVIVGPGVVDENDTEVTKANYTQMLGKKLFIDPVKLYKYGHKAGDSIEYTEHLCCDSKGSGAHDNSSEAYKSIVSKTFTVRIQ